MDDTPPTTEPAPSRRGGRPRAAHPLASSISAHVTADDHDRLIALARKHDCSVSSLVRSLLIRQLR